MKKVECFKIQLLESNRDFDLSKARSLLKIMCGKTSLLNEPTSIVADPFLFVKQGTLYLFYEDKKLYHKGTISMTKTTDLLEWTAPVTVLEESCHLSYPWVFEEGGHVYMIPETCGLKEIRLYEADEELQKFTYVKTILNDENACTEGFSFSDTSIYHNDDMYYLMTTVNDGKRNILKLYISDKFDEGYREHLMSPISADNMYGRNAGSLLEIDGQLYRVAQDCKKRYGDNVNLLIIEEMNKATYRERVVKNSIIPTAIPFYNEGGHQFNMVEFKGKHIIATDAKEYHYFMLDRIKRKLLQIF